MLTVIYFQNKILVKSAERPPSLHYIKKGIPKQLKGGSLRSFLKLGGKLTAEWELKAEIPQVDMYQMFQTQNNDTRVAFRNLTSGYYCMSVSI